MGVIPFSVKLVALLPDTGPLSAGDLDPLWVFAGMEFCLDPQTGLGLRRRKQIDDHLVTDQRLAAPF